MNDRADTLTELEVEDRLRRTFAVRAGDMAPGDGALWRPVDRNGRRSGDRAVPYDAPPLPLPGEGEAQPAHRRGRRRALAVAAALLVAGGATAAALAAVAGTDDDGDPRDPATDVQQPTTTTTVPTTVTTLPGGSYFVGSFTRGEGEREESLYAMFDPGQGGADIDIAALLGSSWQEVQAGPNRGYVATGQGANQLWLTFDDGIVRLQGDTVPADELIAVAATVAKDPSTGQYTMPTPAGWTESDMFEGDRPRDAGEPARGEPPPSIGYFVDGAGASYGAIWYRGWTTDELPARAEPVEVTDGQAYVGTVAPGARGLLQLWIVYEDGAVELQASFMTRDELVAAGNGVVRRPGTEEFDLTPPPGFTAEPTG